MKLKSDFLNEIYQRGFIYQSTDLEDLDQYLNKNKITGYIGFDITNDSLHIGSLVQLMLLNWMDYFEQKPIALVGGGTTLIGDPSGKIKSRPIISREEINKNIVNIKKTFGRYINLDGNGKVVDNYDWLSKLEWIDFLREIGSKITINKMLTFDSVKKRIDNEQPLSFLEFNYMIFQAYDFYYLNKYYNCSLQMGGSDQWGNIVSGIDLVKKISKKNAYAITSPLITNSDGSKMGKTADGAVWLDEKKLSDYDFFQFWRNVDDRNVGKFLKLFTKLPLKEIDKLAKLEGAEINEAKKILSFEVTKIARGYNEANNALQISENTFNEKIIDERLNSIEIKSIDLVKSLFNLIDAVEKLNLVKSRSEIKRLIKSNGIKVNDETFNDNEFSLKNYSSNKEIKISVGKKKIGLIKVIN